jgi:plastocyanin domain-containing protein
MLSRSALAIVPALALAALTASCSKPSDAAPPPGAGAAAVTLEGRRVDITAGPEGYSPATIEAKKGEALVLRFTRTTKSDCLAKVVFPDLKVTKDLPLNTPVEIAVKADAPGKIPFHCGMDMVHGSVDVTGG